MARGKKHYMYMKPVVKIMIYMNIYFYKTQDSLFMYFTSILMLFRNDICREAMLLIKFGEYVKYLRESPTFFAKMLYVDTCCACQI